MADFSMCNVHVGSDQKAGTHGLTLVANGMHQHRRGVKLFTDKVEHSGNVEHVDLSHLSESQLEEIEKIIQSATPDPK